MPPTLYLIDGHALAYRTFFALTRGSTGGFITRSGEPTAGVFGFTSVLLRILEQDRPDYLIVAFDTGKTFRDEIFPEYKGTREKMPEDLRSQIKRIRQLVDAFNIPRLEIAGFEADDVLGSVARKAVKQGLGVKIITGDRDLLQLVDDRIIVNLPGKSLSDARDFLSKDVVEYLGVRPDQVVDFKALVGDKSDNIPGVPGIGEKTAITLLNTYGDLDGVYNHLGEITGSLHNKLESGRDSAYLSRKLAEIVTDLDVPLNLEQARPDRFDPAPVENIFRELEFRTLMSRLDHLKQIYGMTSRNEGEQLAMFDRMEPALVPISVSVKDQSATDKSATDQSATEQSGNEKSVQTYVIDTQRSLEELVARLNSAEMIAFDTETTSTNQMVADLVGISLAINENEAYYIPVGHRTESGTQLPIPKVIEALRKPMTDPRIPKNGHNIKYDFVVLARYGLRVTPLGFDTMIAEWLSNPNSRNLGLKNLAWVRLDFRMTEIEELIGKGKNQITMAQVPIASAASYAAADAAVVLRLISLLRKDLENSNALKLFSDIEMPLIPVLADMEMAGIPVDTGFLADMSQEISARLSAIEAQVYEVAGKPFNLNSPPQLSDVLFNRLKLEPPDRTSRTSTGFYSTAAGVLDSLRGQHPVVDWVLEYRELSKLKSTYLDALPVQVNPATGRVHTSYSQTGSVTGRIASSDPNLQNIPIRTEIGRKVRQAFIADPGYSLLCVDYSQVELRIVAHVSGDEAMLSAFRAGQDIHTATAAAIYAIPLEDVTKEQRRHAKAINFGLIYGMSPFGLTRTTDLTLAEAEEFVKAYFRQFPGIKSYLDGMRRQATEQGYVETLLGRRRYFPGLKNQTDRNIRAREEREAINAPIQGTAADIMKLAMLRVPGALAREGLTARMLLQVHDELVLECPHEELGKAAATVRNVMENAYKLDIPLMTEATSGPNWGEVQALKDYHSGRNAL